MKITTVCFDIGGVLVRICHTWEEACGYAGISFRETGRMSSEELILRRRQVVDRFQAGEVSDAEYFRELSLATDRIYSDTEVAAIHERWLLGEYSGACELVHQLSPMVQTACLSNTNQVHWRRLDSLEFPSVARLQTKLASHELRAIKPDPSIYVAAERALGVAPGSILFFDDLAPNVASARAQGWHAEQIDPYADPVAQMTRHLTAHGVF